MIRFLFAAWLVINSGYLLAQAPQLSQLFGNPVYNNPAQSGSAGVARFAVNYRNQWSNLGIPFQTAAFSYDNFAEDAGVGFGALLLHDRRGPYLQSSQIALQASKHIYLDGQQNLSLTGGLQTGWISNRWDDAQIVYVSDLLGLQDPLSGNPLVENRIAFAAGTTLEYAPQEEGMGALWLSGAWHNIGISPSSWMGQSYNMQLGARIPLRSPEYFGNYLGKDLEREVTLTLASQYRKQGPNHQMDTGFNLIYSPLLAGVWYRGTFADKNRHDAVIGVVGWAAGSMFFQASYDVPISSLSPTTGAFEISLWYSVESIFRFTGKGRQDRRSIRTPKY